MQAAPTQKDAKNAEVPADNQKLRKKKTPPLTEGEFAQKVNDAEAAYTRWHRYFAVFNKNGVRTAPTSPNSQETGSLIKSFARLSKLYEHLSKDRKRRTTGPVKGFKQEKLLTAGAIKFCNESSQFSPELQIVARPEAGGDGILCISQLISIIFSHIERNGLKKNPDVKSEVTFDPALKALFAPYMEKIERKKWTTNERGEIVTSQNAVQTLIPKLFDSKVPVHPKLFNEDEQKRMTLRESYLIKRTEDNNVHREKIREDARKADRDAKAAAKAAVAQPAATSQPAK